jgi:hypothetical protein
VKPSVRWSITSIHKLEKRGYGYSCIQYETLNFWSRKMQGELIYLDYLKQANQLASLLDEDPTLTVRRETCAKRLELYRNARDEIDAASWAN